MVLSKGKTIPAGFRTGEEPPVDPAGSVRSSSTARTAAAGRDGFVRAWVWSAAIVTVSRFFNVDGPGHDLGIQIQAAHNLLAGRGLTFYNPYYFDSTLGLTDPTLPTTLTHFPAGYSVEAAALLGLGVNVGVTIKILAALATMLGWWGWARLARAFVGEGIGSLGVAKALAFVIAIGLPLLFTPSWGGTDIFLWAAVPWVLDFVIRAAREETPRDRMFDCAAGVLCGFAILTRYASVFLVAYAAAIILWQSMKRPAVLIRRAALFGIGLVPLLAVQVGIILSARSGVTPGGLTVDAKSPPVLDRLAQGLGLMHTSNEFWSFWLPGKILSLLFPDNAGPLAWQTADPLPIQLGITLGFYILLAYVAFSRRGRMERDPMVLSLGLFVFLPCVLLGAMAFGQWDYVGDRRYYRPLIPLMVLVAYSVAFVDSGRKTLIATVLRGSLKLYVLGFAAMTVVYVLLMLTPTGLGGTQRLKLMGAAVHGWPSLAIAQEQMPSRQFVISRLKEHPDAVLLTSRLMLFQWDRGVDNSRVHGVDCDDVLDASGPATVIIHTFDLGRPEEVWSTDGTAFVGKNIPESCWSVLPNLRLLEHFPDEGLKVLEARIDANQHLVLRREASGAK